MAEEDNSTGYVMIFSIPECNLFCEYCRKEDIESKGLLTNQQILDFSSVCYDAGIRRLRWTGGEPTARPGFIDLVAGARERGIEEQYLSTNGTLLYKMAPELRENGLRRVNISLDTFNRERFREITRRDLLEGVLKSIEVAATHFDLVKINTVVMREYLTEIHQFIDYISGFNQNTPIPRFIPLGGCGGNVELTDLEILRPTEILEEFVKRYGKIQPFLGVEANNPFIEYYQIPQRGVVFGVANPFSLDQGFFPKNSPMLRINPNGYVGNDFYSQDVRFLPEMSHNEQVTAIQELIEGKKEHTEEWYREAVTKPLKHELDFWRFGKED